MKIITAFAASAVFLSSGIASAFADDLPGEEGDISQAIFGFGGAMTKENMSKSANPAGVSYEGHPVVGLGYQLFPYRLGDVRLGLEVGAAGRFGGKRSAEIWGGLVVRHDGFVVADRIRISPAITVGLSHVSRTHQGREQELEDRYNGNARTLFYLGPEINISLPDDPRFELFWRLHHRSGGGKTLGNMKGASNANVIGLRYKF